MKYNKDDNFSSLRSRAERLLQGREASADKVNPQEYEQLLHEFQVHQIELELQNEELRLSQTKLEEHRNRYMRLYHHAPVGYVVLKPSGIIREANTTFANLVGVESPQIHGKPFADFLVKEDQAVFRARFRSLFKQPLDKHIEMRLQSTENSYRYVDLAATLQYRQETSGEASKELFVTVTDITARAEAKRALQDFQDFTVAIIDSLSSNVCVLDEYGTILMVNEAWRRFAVENSPNGANLAEGTNYLAVCDSVDGDEKESARTFAAGIRAILKDESDSFTLEYPCHSPKEERWFIARATKLINDIPFAKVVVAHENITERKQLEQEQLYLHDQFKQIAKAESLGTMAGAIAHNFNNMLGAVLGNLELALDIQQGGEDPTSTVKNALKAAWKASEISGLMLTYLGQEVAQKKAVDFSSVCSKGFHLLQLAKPSEITMTTDFPAPGPFVKADNEQLQQIVSNLVANAWEAIEGEPGTVDVSISTVHSEEISRKYRFPLDWQPEDQDYVCLTVRDDGCGIPAKDIENIFDPFFTSKFTGRGMGLSVVLGILRSHEGAVTVKSKPKEGSVFSIYIPVCIP